MPAPQKVSRKETRSQPQLSQFIKQLDFKPFHKALPRGTQKEEKLYYPPVVMLKALILCLLLNLTYRELEQLLRGHTRYAKACGFMKGYIPDHAYYCKFFTSIRWILLEDKGVKILKQLIKRLEIPCKVITIDSSCFIAWANSFSKRADQDAGTGKSSTKGWFFGYKVHLAVDATMELPVAIIVTPGNHYDGYELRPLLEEVTTHISRLIQAVTADKGYDAGYNYLDIVELFQALPIIPK